MMAAGTGLRAQQPTITLNPGWNWISYPEAVAMEIEMALGSFVPAEGDIVKSQFGFSVYQEGQWQGSFTHFMPGMGYMYCSSRSEVTSFFFANASSSVVATATPAEITATSAVVGGMVTLPEGSHVFLRGVCWGTEPNPDIDGNHTSNATGVGSYSDTLVDLNPSTTYYVRAYVVSDYGLAYGNALSFTTESDGGGEHEYVDLGLPSGLLWATCNIGADTPEDYGDYFVWGETQPKDIYYWSTYQYCMGSGNTLTKYCSNAEYGYNGFTDNLTTLEPSDDAATANWGSDWRMPSKAEFEELYNNTTVTWTMQNGVYGSLFTATNGNTLFLPAAGYREESSLGGAGSYGLYWSSSLDTDYPSYAWYIYFYSDGCFMHSYGREGGQSVRPVLPASQNTSYIIDVTANPAVGGTISGGGTYEQGQSCTVTATANAGYTFTNWTENGTVVSTDATYTFTVNANRTLVANFAGSGLPYYQDFASSFGTYTTYNVAGAQSWEIDYSVAKMTGYAYSTNYANEDWLISAKFSLEDVSSASLTMTYIARYFNNLDSDITIQISSDYISGDPTLAYWTQVPASWTSGNNWTDFVSTTVDLSQFVGQKICVAVRYLSDDQKAGTIEVQSILIQEGSGSTPPFGPNPGGEVQNMPYVQSFASEFGTYITYDILGAQSWEIDYGTVKITGYYGGSYYANEDWLISSPVAITGVSDAKMTISYIGRYFNNINDEVTIWASPNYTWGSNPEEITWTQVFANLTEGSNWSDFLTAEISLTQFVGQTVTFAVKYMSANSRAGTIEIQSITIEECGGDGPNPPTPGGGDHGYVDLGLPSGLLWATCNVGANAPEDYGDYFAWGETEPKDYYNWSTYQYCMGNENALTRYCNNSSYGNNGFADNLSVLLFEDDAATANWGSDWRMPTFDEWEELYNYTSYTYTTRNGVNGMLFTASNGNSLFLPAAGYRYGTSLVYAGTYGFYWSSSLFMDFPDLAWYLTFDSGYCDAYNGGSRTDGQSVRPVRSASKN